MSKNHGERIASLESKVVKLEAESIAHGNALHKHGKDIHGISMVNDTINVALDKIHSMLDMFPEKVETAITKAVAPIKEVADSAKLTAENNRLENEKWKSMFKGGAWVAGSLMALVLVLLSFIGYLIKQKLGL